MKILHVTCSPRGQDSESHRLSQRIIGSLRRIVPASTVIRRDISGTALSPIDEDYAVSQQAPADISDAGTAARSDELIRELETSDIVVIGTPMHNFTVPAALKLWLDHVVRVRRTFDVGRDGKVALLKDRPVFVAVSSGGRFSGPGARQPDFLVPYMQAILGMIGLHELTFFSVQGTAFGPQAVAEARARAEQAMQDHFSTAVPPCT